MSALEIFFLIKQSTGVAPAIGAFISLVATGFLMACYLEADSNNYDKDKKLFKYFGKISFGIFLISLPLAVMPNVNDLFKVRIGLIKYHAVSPANLEKGIQHVEKIAKKLECKYLEVNCSKEESNEKVSNK